MSAQHFDGGLTPDHFVPTFSEETDRILKTVAEHFAVLRAGASDPSTYSEPPKWAGELLAFIQAEALAIVQLEGVPGEVLREAIRQILGTLVIAAGHGPADGEISRIASLLSGLGEEDVTDDTFLAFLGSRRVALAEALDQGDPIVLVRGHENPDTDTVISAIGESFRQHLISGDHQVFVPVLPGARVPAEVKGLLGKELAEALVRSVEELCQRAVESPGTTWILVDHTKGAAGQRVRAVIDHHEPSPEVLELILPRRIVVAGSTAALVAQLFLGLGAGIPGALARLLYGATLMDTEKRTPKKMTPLDGAVMDRLRLEAAEARDEGDLYRELMRGLLSSDDPDLLFARDYKEKAGRSGFAVVKGIGMLEAGRRDLVDGLGELARQANRQGGLALTIVKVVDYLEDAETVRAERVMTIFDDGVEEAYRAAVREAVVAVIRREVSTSLEIQVDPEAIAFESLGAQLSRKKIWPAVESVGR
jgi:inorganic pyrophosphatase/exopolyphosphatase